MAAFGTPSILSSAASFRGRARDGRRVGRAGQDSGGHVWRKIPCMGDVPGPRSGAASVVVGDKIYMFGGYGGGGRLGGCCLRISALSRTCLNLRSFLQKTFMSTTLRARCLSASTLMGQQRLVNVRTMASFSTTIACTSLGATMAKPGSTIFTNTASSSIVGGLSKPREKNLIRDSATSLLFTETLSSFLEATMVPAG